MVFSLKNQRHKVTSTRARGPCFLLPALRGFRSITRPGARARGMPDEALPYGRVFGALKRYLGFIEKISL